MLLNDQEMLLCLPQKKERRYEVSYIAISLTEGSVIARVAFPGILNVQEDVKGKALVYTENRIMMHIFGG